MITKNTYSDWTKDATNLINTRLLVPRKERKNFLKPIIPLTTGETTGEKEEEPNYYIEINLPINEVRVQRKRERKCVIGDTTIITKITSSDWTKDATNIIDTRTLASWMEKKIFLERETVEVEASSLEGVNLSFSEMLNEKNMKISGMFF